MLPQHETDQAARVLQVVLSAAAGWDIKTVCSLLQVSTACRRAIFESGVTCEVSTERQLRYLRNGLVQVRTVRCLQRVAHFCAWLPGQASLVRKLVLKPPASEAGVVASQELFSLALQLCAQQYAAAAAGGSAAQQVSATGLARPLQRLQLQSLDSHMQLQPAALAALASCSSLTELSMPQLPAGRPSPEICCSLGLLTGLQRLLISAVAQMDRQPLPEPFAASLAPLSNLTELECHARMSVASWRDLPTQLLSLRLVTRNQAAPLSEASLQHITGLQALHLFCSGTESQLQVCLPTSLTALSALANGSLQIVPTAFPSVAKLAVVPTDIDMVDFGSLPKLRTLQIWCSYIAAAGRLTAAQADAVTAAIAAAKGITKLTLNRAATDTSIMRAVDDGDSCIMFENSVARLTQLCKLVVTGFRVHPSDMLRLTALTNLEELKVVECPALGDTAAVALAGKLTALTALHLQGCGLQSPVLLPALVSCTGLRDLNLQSNVLPVSDDTLLLLTSLQQLTRLVLPAAASTVSADGEQQFQAAMTQLESLQLLP